MFYHTILKTREVKGLDRHKITVTQEQELVCYCGERWLQAMIACCRVENLEESNWNVPILRKCMFEETDRLDLI